MDNSSTLRNALMLTPLIGVSIKALRRVDELSMGRDSEQLLPVFIEVAQGIVDGIDHRS